jgi:hypothetical protein
MKMLEEACIYNLDDENEIMHPFEIEDGDHLGFNIWPFDSADWTRFGYFDHANVLDYTYVIDLDNRVFTINGVAHCRFDNMPPGDLGVYIDEDEDDGVRIRIPLEHLATTVDLWPHFDLDVGTAQQQYNELQAIVVPYTAWGAPTWESLSVAQSLCVELIRVLVNYYSYELSLANYSCVRDDIGIFIWQVLSSIAPSSPFYKSRFKNNVVPSYMVEGEVIFSWMPYIATCFRDRKCNRNPRYCLFRGCLVTTCSRIDDSAYLKYEVKQMASALQKNGRTGGVGIIISSWQVLAVTVDSNSEVRHSPALDFHDGKGGLCDGVLLMMHLLSPVLTTPKTPWSNVQPRKSCTLGSSLPTELLDQIVQLTDFRTYLNLHSVSSPIRAICLARPRIGDFTILGKKLGQEGVFEVRSSSNASALATIEPKKSVNAMGMPWQMVILSDNGEPDGEN